MFILLSSVSVIGLNDIYTFESNTLHNISDEESDWESLLMKDCQQNRVYLISKIDFLKIESISMTDLRIESLQTDHRINLVPKNSKTSFAV